MLSDELKRTTAVDATETMCLEAYTAANLKVAKLCNHQKGDGAFSLDTSKRYYLDPRITVAWCKLHGVPLNKVYSHLLLSKFDWAVDVGDDFEF